MSRRGLRAPAAAFAVLASLGILAACGGGEDRSFTLRVAFLGPMTGAQQSIGEASRKAVILATKEINKATRKARVAQTVTMVYENDKSTFSGALSGARRLVGKGVSCVVGPYTSNSAIGVSNSVFVPRKMFMISPAANLDALSSIENADLLGRIALPTRAQGQALAELMDAELDGAKGKTANVATMKSKYGTAVTDSFTAAWTKKGGRVGVKVSFPYDQPMFATQARSFTSNKPDAFVFISTQDAYAKFATDLLRTNKWSPTKSFGSEALVEQALATNVVASNGLRGVASGASRDGDGPEAFARLYERAPGPRRQTFDAQSFDAVIVCYLAAVAAGSTDGPKLAKELDVLTSPPGVKYTWQQLPQAIKALQQGQDIDYQGASGPIDINANGEPTAGVLEAIKFDQGRLLVYGQIAVPPPAGRKSAVTLLTPAELAKQLGAGQAGGTAGAIPNVAAPTPSNGASPSTGGSTPGPPAPPGPDSQTAKPESGRSVGPR